ncbi:MAG: hypothetical protein M1147_13095, partial [Nitrospirae bacterium]|nr:hypothetical protein [Nitrospirota bacterium]MCL5979025.1 hypothetical protein [Nitrospirota bacterium]
DIWPWPDYAKRYLHSASFTGFATGSHSSPSLKARGFLAVLINAPEAGIEVKEDLSKEPKVVKFTPKKTGKYPFYCDKKLLFFKSHRERGMEGVIEVIE